MNLQTQGLQTIDDIRAFVAGSQAARFKATCRDDAYELVAHTLKQFRYGSLGRTDKGHVRTYLMHVTGLSRAQVTRLIGQYRDTDRVRDRRGAPSKPFPRRYTDADVRALAEIDALHGQLSGPTTRKLCERACEVFGETRYQRLGGISNGHLYNLRHSTAHRRQRGHYDKTRPTRVTIAERRRPEPHGQPGYLRVDSVHQGDQDRVKGLYHINLVDAVTQYEFVGSVPRITENFLLPLLEDLIDAFPFVIHGLHADNGSEYINHRVAEMLDKLRVTEFTKSRARQSTDNALVESKNASVIRKHLGYGHIPAQFAEAVDAFNRKVLSPYLNFHRPCLFAHDEIDQRGKIRKRYRYQDIATPYDKLKSLPDAHRYLKPGITFQQMDAQAHAISDNEAARRLNQARKELFKPILNPQAPAA